MITVTYFYPTADGYKEGSKEFHDSKKALAFMYTMKKKGFKNFEWITEDPEDNEYLYRRFY